MFAFLRRLLAGFRQPPLLQVAALCWRERPEGGHEVLLIKSLDSGRWIVPKGWPMPGKSLAEAAEIEAWEEAGVRGELSTKALGRFPYLKRDDNGIDRPCEAELYPLKVSHLAEAYPEAGKRKRRWYSPEAAAEAVSERELARMIKSYARKPPC